MPENEQQNTSPFPYGNARETRKQKYILFLYLKIVLYAKVCRNYNELIKVVLYKNLPIK